MPPVTGPEGLGSLRVVEVLDGLSVRVGLADCPGWGEGGTPDADDVGLLVSVVALGVAPSPGVDSRSGLDMLEYEICCSNYVCVNCLVGGEMRLEGVVITLSRRIHTSLFALTWLWAKRQVW